MALRLYMDQHVPRAVTAGLRARGVEVVTAFEDGSSTLPDPELLDRAGALGCVLFSQDDDLLVEATRRQTAGIPFHGVIYTRQLPISIGAWIQDLEIIAKTGEVDDLLNTIVYLPL